MCGIVGGASSFLSDYEITNVKNLLYCSAFRGWDSTGVVSIQERKSAFGMKVGTKWIKSTLDAPSFLAVNGTNKEIFKPEGLRVHALIGHTRAATVGKVERENAHPFNFQNIIGVHNGTMRKKWGNEDKFGTDSEALYYQINERGIRDVVKDIGRGYSVNDAYALVFFDRKENTLNMIRNEDRPLSITKTTGTVYWASESKMLDFVINRDKKHTFDIEELKPWHLYQWEMGKQIGTAEVTDLTPEHKTYSYSRSDNQDRWWETYRGTSRSRVFTNRQKTSKPKTDDIPMDGYVKVYDERISCWLLKNWMHPDRKDIVLNDDGSLPDGWAVKNGLIIPKEVTASPVPRNSDMSELVEATKKKDSSDVPFQKDVSPRVIGAQASEPGSFDFDEFYKGGKVISINDRRSAQDIQRLTKLMEERAAIDEDEPYVDVNGNILSGDETEDALDAGCVACGNIFHIDDVSNAKNELAGAFNKNDTGGRNFTCIACVKDYFDNNPEIHPRIH